MHAHQRILALAYLCCGCAASTNEAASRIGAADCTPADHRAAKASAEAALYSDPNAPVEQRVDDALRRLTQLEKAQMLSGSGWMESQGNARLGIPSIRMADGPMGLRNWTGSSAITNAATINAVFSTAFPSGINAAASWDLELVRSEGQAIARQVKALGRDMILGPTVNIARTPLWGRNFEGYGEDPYLAARMGVAYIEGVQSEGVIATVKHFAANNQEFERHRIDEQIDLRTLHEIYFPAFKAAVQEARVWSVMSAYNMVNGQYCAENAFLLTDTLKKRWGFQGFVISDWGSTYSTERTIQAGMDLEMPGGVPMFNWSANAEFKAAGRGAGWLTSDRVMAAIAAQHLEQSTVDDSVRRILRVLFASGIFDRANAHPPVAPAVTGVDTPEQRTLARTLATESMVLLKNDGELLPLMRNKTRSIAVLGPNAATARPGGGGSSQVRPNYAVSPLEGITQAVGESTTVSYAMGVGMPGEPEDAQLSTDTPAMLRAAVDLAAKSTVAIVVVGNSPKLEGEGFDRSNMDLPERQDALIEAVASVNPRTIVVVVAGAPVTMSRWVKRVSAIIFAGYAGQEAGHAVASLIFGETNPSGKLPITWPRRLEDSTAFGNYPGKDLHVAYADGIYVGYRGFDKKRLEPLYPFGHGLSYSKFTYANLVVEQPLVKFGGSVSVSIDVSNSGKRAGCEVVQLYLRDSESSLDRPEQELKAFRRIALEPGETKNVTFTIDKAAMSFFDPALADWRLEPGEFELLVGASSRDIRLRGKFDVQAAD